MKKQHILGFFDSLVRTPAFLFLCAMFLCGALAGGLTGLHASEGDSAVELTAMLAALPEQAVKSVLCAVLFRLIHLFTNLRKKHTAETVIPWLLLFGIFGIALLRCAMIAFVEVSSFGIGTSTMYLATVHPLLAVYAFTGLFLYGRPMGKKRKDNA